MVEKKCLTSCILAKTKFCYHKTSVKPLIKVYFCVITSCQKSYSFILQKIFTFCFTAFGTHYVFADWHKHYGEFGVSIRSKFAANYVVVLFALGNSQCFYYAGRLYADFFGGVVKLFFVGICCTFYSNSFLHGGGLAKLCSK